MKLLWLHSTTKYLTFSLVLLLTSYSAFAQKSNKKLIKPVVFQGICGKVVEKKGNQMPGPGKPASTGQPIEREILIFPLLNMSQVETGDDGFINSVGEAKPVKTVRSSKDGKFCVGLPVGRFSVIVQEPKGLYANSFDTQNNIFPVIVQKNRRSTIQVEITHQAVF
ncbi:hypothetical protein GCM10028805_33510 [Spirosoma harenae]